MKKLYFALIALVCAVAVNAASSKSETLYLIGEPAGGWDPAKGIACTKTGDGIFEVEITTTGAVWFGFAQEIPGDWATLNSKRYGAAFNGAAPVNGENAMKYPNENAWNLKDAGTYKFTIDTDKLILTCTTDVVVAPVEPTTGLFLRGDITGWDAKPEFKFASDDDENFTLSLEELSGAFKIADSSWGDYNFGFTPGFPLDLNQGYTLDNNSNTNMTLACGSAQNVTIKFNVNTREMIIEQKGTPEPSHYDTPEALYLVGHVNGTAFAPEKALAMTKDGDKFTITATIDDVNEGYGYISFLTKTGSWDDANSSHRYGAAAADIDLDENAPGEFVQYAAGVNASSASSWKVPTGEYDFTVDFADNSVKLDYKGAGVSDIAVDAANAPAVYYNLQGVRIAEPAAGQIVIRRQGNTTTKVLVK